MRRAADIRIPVGVSLALLAVAWAAITAPWIASMLEVLDAPARARTQDVANALPLLSVICSIIVIVRAGPSSRPRLEPSLLAAVPLLVVGIAALALSVPRYGFDALDNGVVTWGASLCMLASIMCAAGVRHSVRHAAWLVWLVAAPPMGIVLADAWSALSAGIVRSATTTSSSAPPAWMTSGAIGLTLFVTCAALLLVSGAAQHARRAGMVALVLALTLTTAWVQAAAWTLVGERGDLAIGIVRALIVAAGTVVLHRVARRREQPRRSVRSIAAGLAVRVEYAPRYVASTLLVFVVAGACGAWASWTMPGRVAAQRAAVTSRPTWRFDGVSMQQVEQIDIPGRRREPSSSQLPVPWNRLVMPVSEDSFASCQVARLPWWLDVWNAPPVVVPFAVIDAAAARSARIVSDHDVVWVIDMPASGRGVARGHEPIEQLRGHLARTIRARHIAAGGGSAMLVYARHHGHPFVMLTTAQAIELEDGRHAYRTLVLATSAARDRDDLRIPAQTPSYRIVNALRAYRDRDARVDADFHDAALRLTRVFDDLVVRGAEPLGHPSRGARPRNACSWSVTYAAAPRVRRR